MAPDEFNEKLDEAVEDLSSDERAGLVGIVLTKNEDNEVGLDSEPMILVDREWVDEKNEETDRAMGEVQISAVAELMEFLAVHHEWPNEQIYNQLIQAAKETHRQKRGDL